MAAYDGPGLLEGMRAFAQKLLPGTGDSVSGVVKNILDAILTLVGILAVIAIVIAGLILLVQGYDEGRRQQAFRAIVNVLIGLLVIFLATAFVRAVIGLIT